MFLQHIIIIFGNLATVSQCFIFCFGNFCLCSSANPNQHNPVASSQQRDTNLSTEKFGLVSIVNKNQNAFFVFKNEDDVFIKEVEITKEMNENIKNKLSEDNQGKDLFLNLYNQKVKKKLLNKIILNKLFITVDTEVKICIKNDDKKNKLCAEIKSLEKRFLNNDNLKAMLFNIIENKFTILFFTFEPYSYIQPIKPTIILYPFDNNNKLKNTQECHQYSAINDYGLKNTNVICEEVFNCCFERSRCVFILFFLNKRIEQNG